MNNVAKFVIGTFLILALSAGWLFALDFAFDLQLDTHALKTIAIGIAKAFSVIAMLFITIISFIAATEAFNDW